LKPTTNKKNLLMIVILLVFLAEEESSPIALMTVRVDLIFDTAMDDCTSDVLEPITYSVNSSIRNLFIDYYMAQYNSSQSFCSPGCENMEVQYVSCSPITTARVKRVDLTHSVVFRVIFTNIRLEHLTLSIHLYFIFTVFVYFWRLLSLVLYETRDNGLKDHYSTKN